MIVMVGAFPFSVVRSMPDEIRLTESEFARSSPMYFPGSGLVTQNTNSSMRVGEEESRYITLRLFGIVPMKRVKVDLLPIESVLIGGDLIGFNAQIDGVLVVHSDNKFLEKGDIISKINNSVLIDAHDFDAQIAGIKTGEFFDLCVIRGGRARNIRIKKSREMGIIIKDETTGVGTITFINPDNNNFSALGHGVGDFETGAIVPIRGGQIFDMRIFGIDKSRAKKVGSYRSQLRNVESSQGDIAKSTDFGLSGCLSLNNLLMHNTTRNKYKISSRYSVKPGKAQIRTTDPDGVTRYFDVQIIKTRYQKTKSSKSMILRITDKELLEHTGGIIHGMSGSPIVQNGKIVGALTHVMLGDVTRGYGIYVDWLV